MTKEFLPPVVDYQTTQTRPEFQGGLLSCTAFGLTSALEVLAERAGKPQQLSPRFLWYYSDKAHLSVERIVATVNRVGVCRDELCPYIVESEYPYKVKDSDTPPELDALLDAADTRIRVSIKRLGGKEEVMRSLAHGHSLITVRVIGGSVEHCEACIGYSDKGMKIHGSGSTIYWEPWESLGLVLTQVYELSCENFPAVPHPDYIEGDLPTFDMATGELSLPVAIVFPIDWQEPSQRFEDVRLTLASFGTVQIDDPDCAGYWPSWNSRRAILSIPTLIVEGKRYPRVTLTNPTLGKLLNARQV